MRRPSGVLIACLVAGAAAAGAAPAVCAQDNQTAGPGTALPTTIGRHQLPAGYLGITFTCRLKSGWSPDGLAVIHYEYPAVASVQEESPAARAGIEPGDTIVAYNGRDVRPRDRAQPATAAQRSARDSAPPQRSDARCRREHRPASARLRGRLGCRPAHAARRDAARAGVWRHDDRPAGRADVLRSTAAHAQCALVGADWSRCSSNGDELEPLVAHMSWRPLPTCARPSD